MMMRSRHFGYPQPASDTPSARADQFGCRRIGRDGHHLGAHHVLYRWASQAGLAAGAYWATSTSSTVMRLSSTIRRTCGSRRSTVSGGPPTSGQWQVE